MKLNQQASQPLTGSSLLQAVKALDGCSREEKARRCGYSSLQTNGKERLHLVKFLNALLDAEGIDIDGNIDEPEDGKRRGRRARYLVSVQSNGNILIGSQYTKMMSLQPGDEFEVAIGQQKIQLNQVTA
jgi:hypothetical protein